MRACLCHHGCVLRPHTCLPDPSMVVPSSRNQEDLATQTAASSAHAAASACAAESSRAPAPPPVRSPAHARHARSSFAHSLASSRPSSQCSLAHIRCVYAPSSHMRTVRAVSSAAHTPARTFTRSAFCMHAQVNLVVSRAHTRALVRHAHGARVRRCQCSLFACRDVRIGAHATAWHPPPAPV